MNNLEKMVIDMYSEINYLKQKQSIQESIIHALEIKGFGSEKVTKTVARKYILGKLKDANPQYTVEIGNREIDADIILTGTKKIKVKLLYSRSYLPYPSGWNTIELNSILNSTVDIYIFAVHFSGKYHSFFFTRDDLIHYINSNQKKSDSAGLVHFYFRIPCENKIIDARDGEFYVQQYYERWSLPSAI